MSNLSKKRRDELLSKIRKIKEKFDDDEILATLSELEKEITRKKFGLIWEEHEEEVELETKDKIPVFNEDNERGIDDNSENSYNFLLEGDNLHSLMLLQKTHKAAIDLIYIDPPYNTRNKDFKYNDKYLDKQDTFKHSKWISFMNKRLRIAKTLLKDNGFIFISIDENEMYNLKLLLDDVFGENQFCAQYLWYKSATPPNLSHKVKRNVEYILCYTKKANNIKFTGIQKHSPSNDPMTKPQNSIKTLSFPPKSIKFNRDDGIVKSGIYGTDKFPNVLLDDLIIEGGTNKNTVRFENKFIWIQDTLNSKIKEKTNFFASKNLVISYKKASYSREVPSSLIDDKVGVTTTEVAGKELDLLLEKNKVFDFPKPVSLIKYLLLFIDNKSMTVLDFFAGSGTTAQAVLELNQEDGGDRKFILATNNESNICEEITYNRIKKVIEGYGEKEGISSNMKYYKADFISKESKVVSEKLLKHMKELVQLEHHIDIDNKKIKIVLSEDDLDDFFASDSINECNKLFVSTDVMFLSEQERIIEQLDIEVIEIPIYYYAEELKGVHEL